MADIIQAAKWMREGKRVARPHDMPSMTLGADVYGLVLYDDNSMGVLDVEDLLATDWELVED